jgi:hypothetical protein
VVFDLTLNTASIRETIMFQQRFVCAAVRVGILGVMGMSLTLIEPQTSFAGNCGGHCQVMKRCSELVKEKGAKGSAYQSEFNKCMTDAANYK